jgi:hypothetical protein
MRTRRSPRNQEKLWSDLGRVGAKPVPPRATPEDKVRLAEELLARARASPFTSKRTLALMEGDVLRAKTRAAIAACRAEELRRRGR